MLFQCRTSQRERRPDDGFLTCDGNESVFSSVLVIKSQTVQSSFRNFNHVFQGH